MSETQTTMQKIGEKTRRKFEKTREDIKNILDKMKNNKLGIEETESSPEEQE